MLGEPVLILLLIFVLAPVAEGRSIRHRRASRRHSQSRQTKSDKGKRNRKPHIYDENGRREN
jgi:hypothetical protein